MLLLVVVAVAVAPPSASSYPQSARTKRTRGEQHDGMAAAGGAGSAGLACGRGDRGDWAARIWAAETGANERTGTGSFGS
jgi:hypothetical protein